MAIGIRIAIDALIVISIFFALAGVVGMIRMPDSFNRMQSSTNVATLGVAGVIIGAILYALFGYEEPEVSMAVKLGLLLLFYIVTNPIAGHAIAKAAYRRGIRPKDGFVIDKYGEDLENDDTDN